MYKKLAYTPNNFIIDDNIPDYVHGATLHMLLFSFVWAFGGSLRSNQQLKFNAAFRKELNKLG